MIASHKALPTTFRYSLTASQEVPYFAHNGISYYSNQDRQQKNGLEAYGASFAYGVNTK